MSEENWKQFQGTEIGTFLSSIYGKHNKSNIDYPKPQTKEFIPSRKFNSSGSVQHEPKPKKEIQLEYYRKKPNRLPSLAAVDLIPKRKNERHIKDELAEIQYQQQHYRPAFSKPISTDAEKKRLNQICTHKGGKGLPQDFILPVSKAPFEFEQEKRINSINNAYNLNIRVNPSSRTDMPIMAPKAMTDNEMLAQQITGEINDRIAHLNEMKARGIINKFEETTIQNEIKQRARELQMLHNSI